MTKTFKVLAITLALLTVTALSAEAQTALTFEGLQNLKPVANFYNGGLGSGPGTNYGTSFGADSLAVISGTNGGTGRVFLSGSLKLVDSELLRGSKQCAFDYLLVANLDRVMGPLASEFKSRSGQLDLNILLNEDLSALAGRRTDFNRPGDWSKGEDLNHRLCVGISGGSHSVDPTPEPASILLFGSGLFVLGAALHRRKGTVISGRLRSSV